MRARPSEVMIKLFRDRPWLFVVCGLGFMVSLSIAFLIIAVNNPPTLIPK